MSFEREPIDDWISNSRVGNSENETVIYGLCLFYVSLPHLLLLGASGVNIGSWGTLILIYRIRIKTGCRS